MTVTCHRHPQEMIRIDMHTALRLIHLLRTAMPRWLSVQFHPALRGGVGARKRGGLTARTTLSQMCKHSLLCCSSTRVDMVQVPRTMHCHRPTTPAYCRSSRVNLACLHHACGQGRLPRRLLDGRKRSADPGQLAAAAAVLCMGHTRVLLMLRRDGTPGHDQLTLPVWPSAHAAAKVRGCNTCAVPTCRGCVASGMRPKPPTGQPSWRRVHASLWSRQTCPEQMHCRA